MSKPRILVVDDHPYICKAVAQILEPTFEIVGYLGNGQALLEAAPKLNPDVIITDISLPILNGIEAADKLKGLGSVSRIVFLTAFQDSDFVNICLATGALGYVIKAKMARDLVSAIQEALKGHTFVSAIS